MRRSDKVIKVSYFSHVLSGTGVKTDPMKIAAIQDMEPPKSKSELLSMIKRTTLS